MSHHILFLGKKVRSFQFVEQILDKSFFSVKFLPIEEFMNAPKTLENIKLIILEAVPLSTNDLHVVHFLKRKSPYLQVPILALIEAKPLRLRYRLVETGADDYLTIPFDRLDLKVKVKNLIDISNNKQHSEDDKDTSVEIIPIMNQLLKRFNQPPLNFDSKILIKDILLKLKTILNAHSILLFDLIDENFVILRNVTPEKIIANFPRLNLSEFPLLEKVVLLKKSTFLNSSLSQNPFVKYLSSFLQIQVDAIGLYPLVSNNEIRFILVILKINRDLFNENQYELIQVFSELIQYLFYVDEIKQTEKKQLERQKWNFYYDFLERIVNKLDFGILVLDNKYRIKFINEKAAQIFRVSKEDVIYNPLTCILKEEEVQAILAFKERHINTLERPEMKIELGKKEKILLGFSVYYYPDEGSDEGGYIISLKDITIRKEMQEEKDRIELLSSLGTMATGIAHEIRNPLTGIKAIAQTMEEEIDENNPHREYLSRIIRQVSRLDSLLKSLYSYARPTRPKRQYCSIEDILADVMGSLRKEIKEKNIQIIEKLSSNLPEIYVDHEQISQAISNIVINSIEAIDSEGEIKISVQSLENGQPVSKEFLRFLIQGKPYVEIHIHDSGCGISQTHLKHIFNPFFSTKMLATGLGLSIAYQTVRQNGGLIYFVSNEQEGTDCHLILPAYDSPFELVE